MSRRRSEPLGLIGGLGPRATARLYLDLTRRAGRGSALPRLMVYSVPVTRAIEDAFLVGPVDPLAAEMREMRALLEEAVDGLIAAGARRVAMPCNTLQDILAEVCGGRDIELVNMVDAAVRAVVRHGSEEVLVLATRATCRWDVYGRRLAARGVRCVYPDPALQARVERRIRAALDLDHMGRDSAFVEAIAAHVRPGRGVVIACTDLAGDLDGLPGVPVFDALDCLVDSIDIAPGPPEVAPVGRCAG